MSNRLTITQLTAVAVAAVVGLVAAQSRATVLTFDIRYSSNTLYYGSGASFTNTTTDPGGYVGDYGDHVGSATTMINPFYRPNRNVNTGNVGPVWYNYGQGNGFTPNIGVTYQATTNDLETHDFIPAYWPRIMRPTGTTPYSVTLTPDADYIVRLNSFALLSADVGLTHTLRWALYKDTIGGTILASSTSTGGTQIGNLAAQNFTMSDVGPTGKVFTISAADSIAYHTGPLLLQITYVSGTGAHTLGLDNVNFDQHTAPEPASAALLAVGAWAALRRSRARA